MIEHEQVDLIFPPPISNQFTIDCLIEASLGPDYYVVLPMNNNQANAEILDAILRKYSREYNKLVKKKQKELRRNGK